jgi:uracil-DNA glycosylase
LPEQIDLFELVPSNWRSFFDRSTLANLSKKLSTVDFLPSKENIFRALVLPPEDIRVVILGQDPYPNPAHAMGLAFSVPKSVSKLPASLQNIFKELSTDLGIVNITGDLTAWQNQGVLLLNRILTVAPGASLSHKEFGWQAVTEHLLSQLKTSKLVAILWGKHAQAAQHFFPPENTIKSVHPSPLSAHNGYFGSKPFSKCNEMLSRLGHAEINWQI